MTDPIKTRREGAILEVTLDRPKANAIDLKTSRLMGEVFRDFRDDESLRVAIITAAGEKFFCPGWDLKAAADGDAVDGDYGVGGFGGLQELRGLNKPVIAAVSGFCLGGGLELAMMCDILLAGSNAQFGQPEINLGVIPGAGGTQRLIRAVGKSKAMEMVLTGNRITAQEAMEIGLASKVINSEVLLDEAVKMGFGIAEKGGVAVRACKEVVNAAEEMTLSQGLRFERRMFHALFATKDQKEVSTKF